MASILHINGRWRAQVRAPKGGLCPNGKRSMAESFDLKRDAEAWGRRIEAAMKQQKPALLAESMTVATLLDQYRRMRADLGRPVAPESNTHYMLAHLDEDLGSERVAELTPQRLAQWAKMRAEQGAAAAKAVRRVDVRPFGPMVASATFHGSRNDELAGSSSLATFAALQLGLQRSHLGHVVGLHPHLHRHPACFSVPGALVALALGRRLGALQDFHQLHGLPESRAFRPRIVTSTPRH